MSDGQEYKVFVGGLALQSREDSLRDYFSTFGEIVDVVVMMDRNMEPPKSRGFGFVTFATNEGRETCLEITEREIDGKRVEVKRAVPKGEPVDRGRNDASVRTRVKKVFLGGMSLETTKEQIEDGFLDSNLFPPGTTFDIQIMTEPGTEKPRGFGFVTCEPPHGESDDCIYDAVHTLTKERKFMKILERSVELKPAVPKNEMAPARGDGQRGQQRQYNDNRYGGDVQSFQKASYDAMRQQYQDYVTRASRVDYGMSGGYPMPGYDRAAAAYYDAAAAAYPGYYGMGSSYQQAGSSYGPTRGATGGGYSGATGGGYSGTTGGGGGYGGNGGGGYGGADRREHRGSYHPYQRH